MKKLFISQPMKGKSDEEILAEREKAIQRAKEADAKPLWYLGESLKLLATADVAYFALGWEDARGCKIEHTCALEYGIDVIENWRD